VISAANASGELMEPTPSSCSSGALLLNSDQRQGGDQIYNGFFAGTGQDWGVLT